jgi:hypothetical protein
VHAYHGARHERDQQRPAGEHGHGHPSTEPRRTAGTTGGTPPPNRGRRGTHTAPDGPVRRP